MNVHPQCYICNCIRHGEMFAYGIALDKMYGPGTALKLHERRQETHKFTVEELEGVISKSMEYIKNHE